VTTIDAIEAYLSHQRLGGREPSTVRTTRHALRTVLALALDDELSDLAAEGVGEALLTILRQRVSQTGGKPLAESTQALYVSIVRAFFGWCLGKGWLRANPLELARPAPTTSARPTLPLVPLVSPLAPSHVGEIVRWLRERSRLTRRQIGKQTGILVASLRSLELGQHAPAAALIGQLLQAPSMSTLPERVRAAGLDRGLEDNGVGEA